MPLSDAMPSPVSLQKYIAVRDESTESQQNPTKPLVSVVIPCYNQARFLGEAIESVLNQTYPNVEIIVVNDGSTDHTSEVALQYSKVRYFEQQNQGLAAARNKGFSESRGSYLVFLDADDRLLPSAIGAGVLCFGAHPECAFVFGHHKRIASDGSPIEKSEPYWNSDDQYLTLLRGNYIGMHATVMYRRNILESVEGFDTSLAACEDYDLFLRVARRFPIYRHGEVVAEYRMHDANMSRDTGMMLQTVLEVLRSQWKYVKVDKRCRSAYKIGMRSWKHYYGKELIKQAFHMMITGHAGQAIKLATVFVRHVGVVTTLRFALMWLVQRSTELLPRQYRTR